MSDSSPNIESGVDAASEQAAPSTTDSNVDTKAVADAAADAADQPTTTATKDDDDDDDGEEAKTNDEVAAVTTTTTATTADAHVVGGYDIDPHNLLATPTPGGAANGDEAKDDNDGGDGFIEAQERERVAAVIPRLDDLIVKALADNYHRYPALDRIPPEYLDSVIALLDPYKISFETAARHVTSEKFWKRLASERWRLCPVREHGNSWRRMYMEHHLAGLIEAYYPSQATNNFRLLMREVDAGMHFVRTLKLKQLLSHLDLAPLLERAPSLCTLDLSYGARKLGMEFDKGLFGMHAADAEALASYLSKTHTLTTLRLQENLLTDETTTTLCDGFVQNDTLTCLDLAHNRIGYAGVRRLSKWLASGASVLLELDLSDNDVGGDGAAALGKALSVNDTMTTLSLRLNAVGDEGGAALVAGIAGNKASALTSLDVSACYLQRVAGEQLLALVGSTHTLRSLDVSNNEAVSDLDAARALMSTLTTRNESLLHLVLNNNPGVSQRAPEATAGRISAAKAAESEAEANAAKAAIYADFKAEMRKRLANDKQERRKQFEDGWSSE
jgi:hypothetical protein